MALPNNAPPTRDEALRNEARRALARELAEKLTARLAALAVYGGSCPCGNAELRAHLAELERLAGAPPALPGRRGSK